MMTVVTAMDDPQVLHMPKSTYVNCSIEHKISLIILKTRTYITANNTVIITNITYCTVGMRRLIELATFVLRKNQLHF